MLCLVNPGVSAGGGMNSFLHALKSTAQVYVEGGVTNLDCVVVDPSSPQKAYGVQLMVVG